MKTVRPSDLELQAMSVLWAAGKATVHDVLNQMPDGKCRAYTTVLTVLQKLEAKGLVRKTFNGHHNIYFATKTREVTVGRFIHEMVMRVFHGRAADLIEQILAGVTLTPGETKAVAKAYKETIEFVAPLFLKNDHEGDLALVIRHSGSGYKCTTLLPLDSAYKGARQLGPVTSDWLKPVCCFSEMPVEKSLQFI